jgi:hypothetical protein
MPRGIGKRSMFMEPMKREAFSDTPITILTIFTVSYRSTEVESQPQLQCQCGEEEILQGSGASVSMGNGK